MKITVSETLMVRVPRKKLKPDACCLMPGDDRREEHCS
jgi:hypothetical protein